MAQEAQESKLKLIHLLWTILIVAVGAGIAWGISTNQQSSNTKAIETKVDKDIFKQHNENQIRQMDRLEQTIKDGFKDIKEEIRKH